MKKMLLIAPMLLTAGLVHAGAHFGSEVIITLDIKGTGQAQGSVRAARESDDAEQYIFCSLETVGGSTEPNGKCFARDRAGQMLRCVTNMDPMQNKIIATVNDTSDITFTVGRGGVCGYISVANGSPFDAPK